MNGWRENRRECKEEKWEKYMYRLWITCFCFSTLQINFYQFFFNSFIMYQIRFMTRVLLNPCPKFTKIPCTDSLEAHGRPKKVIQDDLVLLLILHLCTVAHLNCHSLWTSLKLCLFKAKQTQWRRGSYMSNFCCLGPNTLY